MAMSTKSVAPFFMSVAEFVLDQGPPFVIVCQGHVQSRQKALSDTLFHCLAWRQIEQSLDHTPVFKYDQYSHIASVDNLAKQQFSIVETNRAGFACCSERTYIKSAAIPQISEEYCLLPDADLVYRVVEIDITRHADLIFVAKMEPSESIPIMTNTGHPDMLSVLAASIDIVGGKLALEFLDSCDVDNSRYYVDVISGLFKLL